MGDEQEYVERLQGQRLNGEEVRGPDVGSVIPEEGSLGLGRWSTLHCSTVPPNRSRTDAVAQLAEFSHDAHAAPEGILAGQAHDQFPDLSRHR